MKLKYILTSIFIYLLLILSSFKADEGMFLLSQLEKIDLKKAGAHFSVKDLYNPNGTSISDAIVRLDGCTGSFISNNGLIITNHHCAFGAVAAASNTTNNYVDKGFYAEDTNNEIKTTLKVKITQSYLDVSDAVLEGVNDNLSNEERQSLINANINRIVKKESELNSNLKVEISTMTQGKFYTLFRYKVLTDIRLVYVPPRSIGEFGGESDNWVWPRHNGDFSLVRVYENGVPYTPKRFLELNTNGTKAGDFVFVLGYPGRTFRHYPYSFLDYQTQKVIPFIANWFEFKIKTLQDQSNKDEASKLRYVSEIKSLANTSKNYRGKIQGISRTDALESKANTDLEIDKMIQKDQKLKNKYGTIIKDINDIYNEINKTADRDLILNQLYESCGMFFAASFIANNADEIDNLKDGQDLKTVLDKNKENLKKSLVGGYRFHNIDIEKIYMKALLFQLSQLPNSQKIAQIENIAGNTNRQANIDKFVDHLYKNTKLSIKEKQMNMFENKMIVFFAQKDALIAFAKDINSIQNVAIKNSQSRQSKINALMPKYIEAKMAYLDNEFIPDANGTFRFTYGYVKGYEPEDGVYNAPYTTIDGILEKCKSEGDYYLPESIQDIFKTVIPSDNLRNEKGKVTVALLYNLDTTGGNSGSPVMDADGKLIGINFDRAYTATINDYAWNDKYSRSIAVDIRYVIYVLKYIGKTDKILKELHI